MAYCLRRYSRPRAQFIPIRTSRLANNIYSHLCLVPTDLENVAKTQFVLLNHLSSLWCPAKGGPAPHIVWRKNDAVVQNSTSVRLQINVTEEERNTNYSCEVDDHGQLKRKNISLVVESKSQVTSLLQGDLSCCVLLVNLTLCLESILGFLVLE